MCVDLQVAFLAWHKHDLALQTEQTSGSLIPESHLVPGIAPVQAGQVAHLTDTMRCPLQEVKSHSAGRPACTCTTETTPSPASCWQALLQLAVYGPAAAAEPTGAPCHPFKQAKLHRLTQCATPCREALLQISAYGPAFGAAASLAAVLLGLGLSAADLGGGITVQSSAFEDSLLLGLLGEHLHHRF